MFKTFSCLFDNVWSGVAGRQVTHAWVKTRGMLVEDTQWRKVAWGGTQWRKVVGHKH